MKSYATSDQIKLFCKSGADSDDIKDCGSKITFKNSLQNIQESGFTFGLERDFTAKSDLYIKLDTEASAEKLHQNLKLLRDNYVNENIKLTFLKMPYYSISIWNKHRGHLTSDDFRSEAPVATTIL